MKNAPKSPLLTEASVLFATFSLWSGGHRMPTNGSVEPLRDFLAPRARHVVLIDQPVPGSEEVLPVYEVIHNHRSHPAPDYIPWWMRILVSILRNVNTPNTTQPLFKIRDFFSVTDWVWRSKKTYDYLIGLESINALAGIVLRAFGKVRVVVYYVSDYSPNRYANKFFNTVYLALDRYCAKHADYIWDVSKAMQKARISAGLDPRASAPVIHVANGLFPDQILAGAAPGKQAHALAYMGTVGKDNGPDVAIRALSIVRKKYSDATLHIIGGKPADFAWMIPIIRKYGVSDAVKHHGFVPKAGDMVKIMRACSIGLAPYRAIPGSPRYYGDAGKIRAYCGAGLSIVSSPVPPLGQEVAEKGAAIIAHDNPESFAKAIMRIFSDEKLAGSLRKNAQDFARDNTWENQFTKAFTHMSAL